MNTPDQQDATNPSNVLYYAPRHLRERVSALRTTRLDNKNIFETSDAPALEPQAWPTDPFPEALQVPEPVGMEDVEVLRQRARKKEVLAPIFRFVGVASLGALVAFTYVIFTEVPDQKTVDSPAGQSAKAITDHADANSSDIKITESNSDDAITLRKPSSDTDSTAETSATPQAASSPTSETTGSREPAAPITPEQNAALFQQYLQWQDKLAQAQRQETAQRNVPAAQDPPKRKRKGRKRQVDPDE